MRLHCANGLWYCTIAHFRGNIASQLLKFFAVIHLLKKSIKNNDKQRNKLFAESLNVMKLQKRRKQH